MIGLILKGFRLLAGATAGGAAFGTAANQMNKLLGQPSGGDKGPKQQSNKPLTTGETDGGGGIREDMNVVGIDAADPAGSQGPSGYSPPRRDNNNPVPILYYISKQLYGISLLLKNSQPKPYEKAQDSLGGAAVTKSIIPSLGKVTEAFKSVPNRMLKIFGTLAAGSFLYGFFNRSQAGDGEGGNEDGESPLDKFMSKSFTIPVPRIDKTIKHMYDDIVDFGNEVKEEITSTYDKMKEVPLEEVVDNITDIELQRKLTEERNELERNKSKPPEDYDMTSSETGYNALRKNQDLEAAAKVAEEEKQEREDRLEEMKKNNERVRKNINNQERLNEAAKKLSEIEAPDPIPDRTRMIMEAMTPPDKPTLLSEAAKRLSETQSPEPIPDMTKSLMEAMTPPDKPIDPRTYQDFGIEDVGTFEDMVESVLPPIVNELSKVTEDSIRQNTQNQTAGIASGANVIVNNGGTGGPGNETTQTNHITQMGTPDHITDEPTQIKANRRSVYHGVQYTM